MCLEDAVRFLGKRVWRALDIIPEIKWGLKCEVDSYSMQNRYSKPAGKQSFCSCILLPLSPSRASLSPLMVTGTKEPGVPPHPSFANSKQMEEDSRVNQVEETSRSLPPHSYVYFPHEFPGNFAVLRNFEKLLAKTSVAGEGRRSNLSWTQLLSTLVPSQQRGFSNWRKGLMGFSEGKKKDFPSYPSSKLTSSVVSLSL